MNLRSISIAKWQKKIALVQRSVKYYENNVEISFPFNEMMLWLKTEEKILLANRIREFRFTIYCRVAWLVLFGIERNDFEGQNSSIFTELVIDWVTQASTLFTCMELSSIDFLSVSPKRKFKSFLFAFSMAFFSCWEFCSCVIMSRGHKTLQFLFVSFFLLFSSSLMRRWLNLNTFDCIVFCDRLNGTEEQKQN